MNVKDILTAKTAADLIEGHSKEADWESLKDRFRNTDPRLWTTPLGMVSGLALTHALSDPGKRTRLRYAMGTGAGTAAGYGLGSALKEHAPFYDTYRERLQESLTKAKEDAKNKRFLFSISPEDALHEDRINDTVIDFLKKHPDMLIYSDYNNDVDKIISVLKGHKTQGGGTLWDRVAKPKGITGVGDRLSRMIHKVVPEEYKPQHRKNELLYRDRLRMRKHLAELAQELFKDTDRYKEVGPYIQKVRSW